MNITEALNQVLPEMPARIISQRFPRLHPEVVFKEHVQDGEVVVRAFVPGVEAIFNFTPQNWTFVRQFNGLRGYAEVAELYAQETGIQYKEEEVRELAESLESMDFWYKTPLEKKRRSHAEDSRRTAQNAGSEEARMGRPLDAYLPGGQSRQIPRLGARSRRFYLHLVVHLNHVGGLFVHGRYLRNSLERSWPRHFSVLQLRR